MTTDYAQQAQRARDLKMEIADLNATPQTEIQFTEFSPGRTMHKLWSMVDGMEITIPQYMVPAALSKRHPTDRTKFLFTAKRDEAPTFVEGTVRCFRALGSVERESGLLDEAGLGHLSPCPAVALRNELSKRLHAQHRHPDSWAALQDFIQTKERKDAREQQQKQVDAMLSLAGKAAGAVPVAPESTVAAAPEAAPVSGSTCDQCGFVAASAFGLQAHQRGAHKE